jgi:UDP-2-acetamido-2-deoxy-ribo-hexuluronate aminotransferase
MNRLKPISEKMNKPIQMVDLHGQYLKMKPEIDQSIQEVLDSSAFINGQPVKEFAAELAEYLGSKFVIPCANGTEALQVAYMALGLEPGDEVIMPAFNYVASAEAAALLRLKPVFVDVDPGTYNLEVNQLESVITPKTKAIVVVHLFGQSADMEPILSLARKHGIKVIEDNAQALGAVYSFQDGNQQNAGVMGDIGTTSFFPTKTLGCYGDGGAIFTHDEELASVSRMIASHGQAKKYTFERIGLNSRLDTMQAAILRVKLKRLNEWNRARQESAEVYDELLREVEGIVIPFRSDFSTHVFHQYVIRVTGKPRDEVKNALKAAGIPSMVYYPSPLHLQKAFVYLGYTEGDFPVAEKLCNEVLALPIHTELQREEQEQIVSKLKEILH